MTPIRLKGSETRRMGRWFKEASPVIKARIGCPASTPISRRAPVPELPRSSTPLGSFKPPTPRPKTRQLPSLWRSAGTPQALSAAAVRNTSSPSSSPSIRLSPIAKAESSKARCDMDLSPGTRTLPYRASLGKALNGRRVETAAIDGESLR